MSKSSQRKANDTVTTPGGVGINKTLLTPCRRLGLSRKFKATPSPSQNQSSPNTSTSSTPVSVLKIQETPPVKLSEKAVQKRSVGLSSRANIQSRFQTDEAHSPKESENKEPKQDGRKSGRLNKLDEKIKIDTINCTDIKLEEEPCVKVRSDRKQNNSHEEPVANKSNSKDVKSKLGASKPKIKRCLSMKRSSSYEPDESLDLEDLPTTPKTLLSEAFTKECVVDLEKIIEEYNDDPVKLVSNKSKKRSILYSSDEDDFVPSQNSIKLPEDFSTKINELKNQIKIKEDRLADLKRATMYKKLHNVEELEQLTKVWQVGCHNSLRHLLCKLQEHGPMNMPTLLRNLKIPKFIIYNVESDTFC